MAVYYWTCALLNREPHKCLHNPGDHLSAQLVRRRVTDWYMNNNQTNKMLSQELTNKLKDVATNNF